MMRFPGSYPDVSDTVHEDLIGSTTSVQEIVKALARRGCSDLTSSIDWSVRSELPLAGGGFCDVYRGALHEGTKIAIKCLRLYDRPGAEGEKQKIFKRAARELYHWSKLHHCNVLPLMGLTIFRGHICMVSEWVENGSLMSYLRLNPGQDRMKLCMDICEGLCYIHAHNMANVMVSSGGTALIADFGSAQLRDLTLKFTHTSKNTFSLRWAAPELLEDDAPQAGKEADVYACGMTFLETITGKVPYDASSDNQVIRLVAVEKKVPPRPENGIHDGLWNLLISCWAQNPYERPRIVNVRDRLRALVFGQAPDGGAAQFTEQTIASTPYLSFPGGFAPPPLPPSQGPNYRSQRPTVAPPQGPVPVVYSGLQPPPLPRRQPVMRVGSFTLPQQAPSLSQWPPRPVSAGGNINQPPPGPRASPASPQPTSPPPTFAESAPGPGQPPGITIPMPTVSTLLAAETKIIKPSHIIAWAKAVLSLVDRLQPDADPSNPEPIPDPVLARLANAAIQHVTSFTALWPVGGAEPIPPHVAEALYLRGTLRASGAFPEKVARDQRSAFSDFEAATRGGYKPGLFKLGRDYESVNDMAYARKAFEHGARLKEVSCLYRMGMAHLLGQLGIPANPAQAVPLLQEAADLSDIDVPQPAYVFGMLLLGEFGHVQLPSALLTQTLPAPTQANPHPQASEARRRIERSAYLGYGPALYKIGWAYEHAKMGCAYDPLLSVQYYSAASQRGQAEADMALSKWFLCGSEGFFDKDEKLAAVFAKKAAKRKHALGMFARGYCYEAGIGVKADPAKATWWYQKALKAGYTEAGGRLITMLTTSSDAPVSHTELVTGAEPLRSRKGPQTFEEMGFYTTPVTVKDKDCVIM